jgi:hypothetical protein
MKWVYVVLVVWLILLLGRIIEEYRGEVWYSDEVQVIRGGVE